MKINVDVNRKGMRNSISINGTVYKCSTPEANILLELYNNIGKTLSKEQLTSVGWPDRIVTSNSIIVSIANIRKMFKNHIMSEVIVTNLNGYCFIKDNDHTIVLNFHDEMIQQSPEPESAEVLALDTITGTGIPLSQYKNPFKLKGLSLIKFFTLLSLCVCLLIYNVFMLTDMSFDFLTQKKVLVINDEKWIKVVTDEKLIPEVREHYPKLSEGEFVSVYELNNYLNQHNFKGKINEKYSGLEVYTTLTAGAVVQCIVKDYITIHRVDDFSEFKGCDDESN